MQELSSFDSVNLIYQLCLEVLKTCVFNFDYEDRNNIGFDPHTLVYVTHRIERGFDIAMKKVIALYKTDNSKLQYHGAYQPKSLPCLTPII
jgi:hypothetical protein